jgi:regulator of sigma E protease
MNLTIALVGLGLLVLLHEAGHFFTARAVGMRPRRFYLGFPPAIAKIKRNGIEYGLGAIPLGGYVKIPGMHRPAPSDVELYFGRALEEAPELVGSLDRVKRRLADGDLDGARSALPALQHAVEAAELTSGASKSAERGLQEIDDGLASDAYWRARTWKRVLVIFAGPGTNLLIALVLFTAVFMMGGGRLTRTVDGVQSNQPAAQAGLQAGDQVVAINGRPVSPNQISQVISSSHGKLLRLVVRRHGTLVTLGPVRARNRDGVYRLGFFLKGKGLALPDASWASLRLTWTVTKEIGVALGNLTHSSGRKQISSPIGIVQGSQKALHEGLQTYLSVLGLISLSLALLNLLPLLPLDGGHIAFSLIEGVRGRAVGREVYERVSVVGIALVLLLFFIGLSNDINRPPGG